MNTINVKDLDNYKDEIVIDIREKDEFEAGHIPYAKNIPMLSLLLNPQEYLSEFETYYIVCQSGRRSFDLVNELSEYHLVNVEGGTSNYPHELKK